MSGPLVQLQTLLLSLFHGADTEFRIFLLELNLSDDVASAVPSPATTLNHVIYETLQLLRRKGLITPQFFQCLKNRFPRRAEEIGPVCSMFVTRAFHETGERDRVTVQTSAGDISDQVLRRESIVNSLRIVYLARAVTVLRLTTIPIDIVLSPDGQLGVAPPSFWRTPRARKAQTVDLAHEDAFTLHNREKGLRALIRNQRLRPDGSGQLICAGSPCPFRIDIDRARVLDGELLTAGGEQALLICRTA